MHKDINIVFNNEVMNYLNIALKCSFWGYVHRDLYSPMINIIRPMSVEIQSQLKKI